MELEDIKDIQDLITYCLLTIELEQLEAVWRELLGYKYEGGDDYDPAYQSAQADYEDYYFRLRVYFEIQSDIGENRRLKDGEIQEWVKRNSIVDKKAIWQPTIADRLFNWYTQGLEFVSQVREMSALNVSQEVFYYYINANLKDAQEEVQKEWQKERLRDLQSQLLALVKRNFMDNPYSDHYVWILKRLDEYDDLDLMARKEQNTQEGTDRHIKTFQWIGNKPLDEVLKHFEPVGRMFTDGSLEGLKMAFGGGNIYDIKGCIKPSNRNTTAVRYFIYNLTEQGYIFEVDSMDEVMNVLMDSNGSYRRAKSKFVLGEYSLDKAKDDLILTCINNLSQ